MYRLGLPRTSHYTFYYPLRTYPKQQPPPSGLSFSLAHDARRTNARIQQGKNYLHDKKRNIAKTETAHLLYITATFSPDSTSAIPNAYLGSRFGPQSLQPNSGRCRTLKNKTKQSNATNSSVDQHRYLCRHHPCCQTSAERWERDTPVRAPLAMWAVHICVHHSAAYRVYTIPSCD